ncbi:MAG: hypothetical protein HUU38_17905 [Anaerolineales bacterium]|nr:hypothetical protein [Anaerolineales bacterium]
MNALYHRQITASALHKHLPASILEIVIQANLHQDDLKYLLGAYPHYHFDDNAFARTSAYLEEQRQLIFDTLSQGRPHPAWVAFGKITHTLQDFYAHSTYVSLWRARFPQDAWPDPETIEPLLPELMTHPRLMTGRVILLFEILGLLPLLGRFLHPLFPADTHIRMNLDHPKTGPLFPYAIIAARKRTEVEFQDLTQQIRVRLTPLILQKFLTAPQPSSGE